MSDDASFAKIDYSVRPAKYAERRMLAEIFRRVRPFDTPDNYAYIGLGSVWFSDFALFHRTLGVKKMTSIERVTTARDRCEANKPFTNIAMDFRSSSDALPDLDWARRSFLWLDYDDQLAPSMLDDARTVSSHARSGSLLALSVQCQRAREMNDAREEPEGPTGFERFVDRFGRERVGVEVQEDDLIGWRFGELSRAMFSAEIQAGLAVRNMLLPVGQRIQFKPICDFEYADNAKMTTSVGMFVAEGEMARFNSCGYGALDFLPPRSRTVRIDVPLLTIREMRHLEKQLPKLAKAAWPNLGGAPATHANKFARFYRYFPNFAIIEP
jgi:hypothetical protein